jgi:hypothetical protein
MLAKRRENSFSSAANNNYNHNNNYLTHIHNFNSKDNLTISGPQAFSNRDYYKETPIESLRG